MELPCLGHHREYTPLPWKVFAKSLDKKCTAHFLECLVLLPNFKLKYVIFNSSFSDLTGKFLPWFKPQEWLQFCITIRRGLQFFLFQKISIPSLRAVGFTCPLKKNFYFPIWYIFYAINFWIKKFDLDKMHFLKLIF